MLEICPWLAVFSVVVGFSLYSYGYLSSGTDIANVPLAVLRGIIYTVRIFLINADYDAFSSTPETQYLLDNIWLQILFWICHVAALIVVQVALISLLGWKLIDHLRLYFGFYREIYIIKGGDNKALLLGENIAVNDNPHHSVDPKRLIMFLLEEDDDEKKIYEKAARFGGIVKAMDRNRDFLYYLKKTGLKKHGEENGNRRE